MLKTLLGALLAFLPGQAWAQAKGAHQCMVVFDHGAAQRWSGSAAECATRLSPASTYKIPHALIGLETGVVTETTVEKWDGVKHPNQPKWNQDHTVLSAMRPSVLWFFQAMAPQIGAERARAWLQKCQYGNLDTSVASGESVSWLVGQLTVDQRKLVFASAVWRAGGGLDSLDATRLAIRTFVERGLLRPSR